MDINELKSLKKALKLTTQQVSYLADLPYGTVSKIFTGETQNPHYATLEKIDAALQKEAIKERLKAYIAYMKDYFESHPEVEYNHKAFEKHLRELRNNSSSTDPSTAAFTIGNLAKTIPDNVSISDYMSIETSRNIELLDGRLIYANSPGLMHQTIVDNLGFKIKSFIVANNDKCRVFSSGVNVQIDEDDSTNLIPDIVVLCDKNKETESGIWGAPDWIIEVTSPSTRKRDYQDKLYKYMSNGVREYWIVDMQKEIVATYIDDLPMVTHIYKFSDKIPVSIYDGKLTICLDEIIKAR